MKTVISIDVDDDDDDVVLYVNLEGREDCLPPLLLLSSVLDNSAHSN